MFAGLDGSDGDWRMQVVGRKNVDYIHVARCHRLGIVGRIALDAESLGKGGRRRLSS